MLSAPAAGCATRRLRRCCACCVESVRLLALVTAGTGPWRLRYIVRNHHLRSGQFKRHLTCHTTLQLPVQALSNLSPYFHFGQLSAQRAALEATKHKKTDKDAVEGFLEESVVRRELSDNFCFYEPNYDSLECASGWAKESLAKHSSDEREHVYSKCAATCRTRTGPVCSALNARL